MHIYVYVIEFTYVRITFAAGFPRTRPPAEIKFFTTDDEFEVRDFALLQILETVDEIKIGKLRGARDPRNC